MCGKKLFSFLFNAKKNIVTIMCNGYSVKGDLTYN